MDIIAYQKDRDADLSEFERVYTSLKQKYAAGLTSAIHEQYPQKQGELINTVLEINANLASEVRAFVAKSGEKYDPDAVKHLTDDLIKYQEEYAKIKNSQDMKTTLEMILHEDQSKSKNLKFEMNLYIALLVLGIVTILSYIFWMAMPSLPTLPLTAPQ